MARYIFQTKNVDICILFIYNDLNIFLTEELLSGILIVYWKHCFMSISPIAGKPAPTEILLDINRLEKEYYSLKPDAGDPQQRVSFGTSGHRGTPSNGTFNENHIIAIAQAICDYRQKSGINGPLYLGKDTHCASIWCERSVIEVFAANNIETFIQRDGGYTPTPAISRAILAYNKGKKTGLSDGVVLTPSHNPPADGGIKYNTIFGGPSDTDVSGWIQNRANELLRSNLSGIKRLSYDVASTAACMHEYDFMDPYINDLASVVDMEAIRSSGVEIGVDPLGGASVHYWLPIQERYGLQLKNVNIHVDPTFRFMTVDHDGKIRMDCSSPYAMASLVQLKDQFDVAFGCDTDSDRHGIVTPSGGLINPNHYLAVAIRYLIRNRSGWNMNSAIGKTLVSSNIIDAVVLAAHRKLVEVPVGFKFFASGLYDGSFCFGGEESAGASFLKQDGTVWTTDKDGLILGLLAAEIIAKTGKDPWNHYLEISQEFGSRFYTRVDVPASLSVRNQLKSIHPNQVPAKELASEPILAKLSHTPGTHLPIGGLKIVVPSGWIAIRPSGTEDKAKIYAESSKSEEHLQQILFEGRQLMEQLATPS